MKPISYVLFFILCTFLLPATHFASEVSLEPLKESAIDREFIRSLNNNKDPNTLSQKRDEFYSQPFPFNLNMVSLRHWGSKYIDYIKKYKISQEKILVHHDEHRIRLSLRILEKFFPILETHTFLLGYLQDIDFRFIDAFEEIWQQEITDPNWKGRTHPLVMDFIHHIAIPRLAKNHLTEAIQMAYDFKDEKSNTVFIENLCLKPRNTLSPLKS